MLTLVQVLIRLTNVSSLWILLAIFFVLCLPSLNLKDGVVTPVFLSHPLSLYPHL